MEALRNSAEIQQLRELMTHNPTMVQPFIQQLAASNPQITQALGQHPDLLVQLLGNGGGDFDYEGGDGPLPPGVHAISVTEEERAAIGRVSDGF